jgi:methylmalonyl-CoA/ethylmalonyl-CoA epimerase
MAHDTPIRVDHVGIAVESIADAEPVLTALGCEKRTEEAIEDEFRWAYYRLGNASRLELIEPVADESFLTEFLDRYGPGLHHITLEVAAIDAVIEELEAAGLSVVDYEEYEDWTEAFVSPGNPTGTLFQLMEYHEGYAESRSAGSELYIGGGPLGRNDS